MYKWENIQTKTESEYILNIIMDKIKDKKVKRIFSFENPILDKEKNVLYSSTIDEPLYILFEDNYCLIIDFKFYSELFIEYREINNEELEKSMGKISDQQFDILNCHHEVYSWEFDENNNRIEGSFRVKHIYDIKSTYDYIISYSVIGFNHEYEKWINNGIVSDIITIPAGGDYFDGITFALKNGLELTIKPQAAEDDGYYDLIITDKNNVVEYSLVEK